MLLLVVAVRLWLDWVGPLPGDRYTVAHFFDYRRQSQLTQQIATLYATVGTASGAVLTILVGLVALYRRDGARVATGLLLASGVVVISGVLKGIWGPSPLWHQVVPYAGNNFPSGHAAYATAVLGYLAVAGRRHRQPEVLAVCLVLIIGMGPARVIDGSHLVSDAIAGYLLGAGWLILVCLWVGPSISAPNAGGDAIRETSAAPQGHSDPDARVLERS